MAPRPYNIFARFWDKVNKNGPPHPYDPELGCCWLWTSGKSDGYGYFRISSAGSMKSHRFSYQAQKGPVSDNRLICHTCDNRVCVNPTHLYEGDIADNNLDRFEHGGYASGEEHHLARLSAQTAKDIRDAYDEGGKSLSELAKKFGVCKQTVFQIGRRKTWRTL